MTLDLRLMCPLPLLSFVLPAHGRVALLLTPPSGRDDPALYRRMGMCDETFARGDMGDHAIHNLWCAP